MKISGMVMALLAVATIMAGDARAQQVGGRTIKLEKLILGTDDSGMKISKDRYELEHGKSYSLEIESTGKSEYPLYGPDFFANVHLREIEIAGIDVVPLGLHRLTFEEAAKAQLTFVPLRAGTYKLTAEGLEARGVVITFVVR